MYTGNKPPDYYCGGKNRTQRTENGGLSTVFCPDEKLVGCGAHNAERKHGVRGGKGCFKPSVKDNRTEIYNCVLKQNIHEHGSRIAPGEEVNIRIHLLKAAAADKLPKPEKSKPAATPIAAKPRTSVILYQTRFTPKKPYTASLIAASPTELPSGPIARTSTNLSAAISTQKSKRKIPDKTSFVFARLFIL